MYIGIEDARTSTVQVVPTVTSSVSEPVTSTTSGKHIHSIQHSLTDTLYTAGIPKDILQTHSYKLVHAISVNLCNITDALYAKDLIPQQAKEETHVLGRIDKEKASKLVNVIETQLESSLNPEQYLIDVCHVLINQQHCTLTDIATFILHQLGECVCTSI